MNEEQWKEWESNAKLALFPKYTPEEIDQVLKWFKSIKASKEKDLIGEEALSAMLTFVSAGDNFDMYNSLMARLFIYAPLILKSA